MKIKSNSECPISPHFLKFVLEVVASVITHERKEHSISIPIERENSYFVTDFTYAENEQNKASIGTKIRV